MEQDKPQVTADAPLQGYMSSAAHEHHDNFGNTSGIITTMNFMPKIVSNISDCVTFQGNYFE